jgi:hypothetical protein
MALSLSDFRTRFPEFVETGDALVSAKLTEASALVDDDYWGALAEQAQGYMAAHLLALGPVGIRAKLVQPTGETCYLKHLEFLRQALPKRGVACTTAFPSGVLSDCE